MKCDICNNEHEKLFELDNITYCEDCIIILNKEDRINDRYL